MFRRIVRAMAATAIVAAMVAGPARAQTAPSDEKVTFVFGDTREPSSLNPMKGYLAIDFYFWAWTYHLPITFAVDDLGAVDDFVTDVQVSEDGKTFTYTTRDDLKWSDGEPMTAEDMAFTLNMYKSNHAYLPQNYLKLTTSIEATDDTHVVLKSSEPTSLFSGAVPYLYTYILPKHVWSKFDEPKTFPGWPNVGSGPFVVTEYERGQHVIMEPNPYWNGPKPHVDEIIYRIFKNEDAEAEALTQGEIDFGYFDSANIFNALKGQPGIATLDGTIPDFDELGINNGSAVEDPTDTYEPHGDGHPALADVKVRTAIRMAIDSQELVDKVLLGYGQAGTTIVPPVSVAGARWEPTGDEVIAFDPEGARKLLDDAGYVDTDGDGVREMPNGGEPLEFRYYVQTNDQNTVKAAPFIQARLEDIGIKTDVQAMTSGRLGDELIAGTYDLFHWGWIPDPDPDSILSYFQCSDRPPDEQTYGNNDAFYCNPEYDKLYEEQRTTLDPDHRWEIVHQMQKLFYDDATYSVLWYGPTLQAYRTDTFTGYMPQPAPKGDLLDGYSRDAVLNIRPVSDDAGGGGNTTGEAPEPPPTSTSARGIPAGVWIAIAAGIAVIVGIVVLVRRRGSSADRE
jgi:peptide/nickel transport system substrate-binding protein